MVVHLVVKDPSNNGGIIVFNDVEK
jgi:hypothetical protein